MRGPKYRAWLKPEQQMVDVYELTFLGNEILLLSYDMDFYTDDEFKLMQWTGLKDKNGKKIFEGDIVKFHSWGHEVFVGTVEFSTSCGCFGMNISDYFYSFYELEEFYTYI